MVEFREHEWEKLYTIEDPEANEAPPWSVPVYAGIDRCKHCRIFRVTNPELDTWYMKPDWDTSGEEPHCVVKGYEEIV